ncbi:hypothetical protein N7475_004865 [Penicillium sp. IBT 31633x]|nr:hypothetical protein N7475_004865 [Penicillium sp. IBT 31633x]
MPVSFLGLPPELRNEIYALLLVREEPIDPLFGDHKLATNLLATNTTILHEAGSLLYGHNRFDLTSWNHQFVLQFLDIIGFVDASHLQCICVDLPELRDLSGNISLADHSLRTLEKI